MNEMYYPLSEVMGGHILDELHTLNGNVRAIADKEGTPPKRYGFRVNLSDSNPDTRVEYLYDAIGMEPAFMDYTNSKFEYGDWKDIWFVKNNFPCMVTNEGFVDYKLDPTDYSIKEDGTDSDVANTSYNGNAMSAVPLCYVKRYTANGYRYIIFCESKYDDDYKAYAHTRKDGTVMPYAFYPIYKGSMVSSKLRSLSGQRPSQSTTASTEYSAAKANGSAWGIRPWMADELIADLLVLMSKSTNCQAKYGQGHTTDGSSASSLLDTGTLDDKGQFFGYSGTTSQVKVFHMEGFWGDRWDRETGFILDSGKIYVKPTPEGAGYNFTGTGYTEVSDVNICTSNGYVTTMVGNEYGSFPTAVGGSDATYECDYYYVNTSGVRVALRGSNCNNGANCGRYVNVNNDASNANWNIGASVYLIQTHIDYRSINVTLFPQHLLKINL